MVIVVVAWGPVTRFFSPSERGRRPTAQWQVVQMAGDERAVQIRVEECGDRYDGTSVARVGRDVRLTVYTVPDSAETKDDCLPFAQMPTHTVHLGFTLPPDGRVLATRCHSDACVAS